MSRASLITATVVALTVHLTGVSLGQEQQTVNPHMDKNAVTGGCRSCHKGHGEPGSPMLPKPQKQVCMACHGSRADVDRMTQRGLMSSVSNPRLLAEEYSKAYVHPVSETAHSSHEPGVVTCSSCHSPHRGTPPGATGDTVPGERNLSPKDSSRFEYELCQDCHGYQGALTLNLTDISRMLSPENVSYHPVEAPASGSSPSVIPALEGGEINCTDCHGNNNPSGPRGPHASTVRDILSAEYTTVDGSEESTSTYALCYRCHRRQFVLDQSPFPQHKMHIVDQRASCATCHNGHGSVGNRALIRYGEETSIAGVSPSTSTGTLEFISDGPGSGACYLTCHGRDHSPETYGGMELKLGLVESSATFKSRGRPDRPQAAGPEQRTPMRAPRPVKKPAEPPLPPTKESPE